MNDSFSSLKTYPLADMDWLNGIQPRAMEFLHRLQDPNVPGYFSYSLTGDIFCDHTRQNLAGSIFALKLFHLLGGDKSKTIQQTTQRILSFQSPQGTFFDPFILRKRRARTILGSLKRGQFPWPIDEEYLRAETRQAYAALWIHHCLPSHIPLNVITNSDQLNRYLHHLDWTHPWGAGSHTSHQLFFLTLLHETGAMSDETFTQTTKTILSFLDGIQQKSDGAWYKGTPSARQRVNGAMKVLTGFTLVGAQANDPEALIDLCLRHPAQAQHDACDQMNQVLVLRYADAWCGGLHRHEEIQAFCKQILHEWFTYYHETHGGFSFHRGSANRYYYGARVSRGLNEPDIHATLLFFWGLSLMKHLLPLPTLTAIPDILV